MSNNLVKSVNFNWSQLGVYLCLFISISFYAGYSLANLIYDLYDFWSANDNQNYRRIQIRKKFYLKNILKFLSNFLKKWGMRVVKKFTQALTAIDQILEALQIFIKKLKFLDTRQILINLIKELKSTRFKFETKPKFKYLNRRFRYYYRLFKEFIITLSKALGTVSSFIKEVGFGAAIIEFIIQCYNILSLLMSESLAIRSLLYLLYFSLLGLILGLLFGVFKRNKKRNKKIDDLILMLLFLLQIFYMMNKSDFSEKLPFISLDSNEVNGFAIFPLETEEYKEYSQINLFKILLILIIWLRKPSLTGEIPLPILEDPSVLIDIDIIFNDSPNYKELFKIYPKKSI